MNNLPLYCGFGAPGGGEILLVLVVLLLLFGAKRLPGIARSLGRTLEEFRRSAQDVRDELMKEPPVSSRSVKKTEDKKEPGDESSS